jgi:hypothetical protein
MAGEIVRSIEVMGRAKQEAVPDIAAFTFMIVQKAAKKELAHTVHAKKVEVLLAALKKLGIQDTGVKTTWYNAGDVLEWNESARKMIKTGYQVSQHLAVSVGIDMVSDVLVAAQSLADVNGPTFEVSNRDQIEEQVMCAAIANGMATAEGRAKVLGISLGRVITCRESAPAAPVSYGRESFGRECAMNAPSDPTPSIPGGTMEIARTVYLLFELV